MRLEDAPPHGNPSALDTPLSQLAFPARLGGFFDRRGLSTLRDLVALEPAALLVERNLGRKSVRDAARLIHKYLGTPWEEARRQTTTAPHVTATATPSPVAVGPAHSWARLQSTLSLAARARRLSSVGLPTRVERFATSRGLVTVGDLLKLPFDDIGEARSIGPAACTSILTTLAGLDPEGSGRSAGQLDPSARWLDLFRDALRVLPERERLVLTRRSGLGGPAPTLAEMGDALGITRERVRQIESRGLKRVQTANWIDVVRTRMTDRLTRSIHDLVEVEMDPLFEGAEDAAEPFAFFTNVVLAGDLRLVTIEGIQVLTRLPTDRLLTRLRHARDLATELSFPFPWDERYDSLAQALGCTLYDAVDLKLFLDGEWIEESGRAVGFGSRRRDEMIAFVRAASGPVSRGELERRFGRGQMPDDLILLAPALFTTPDRVPDWDRWSRRLPPLVRTIIEREGPQRQWTTFELVPLLLEEAELPEWCNEYALGSILRKSSEVEYLNRNVVALPDSGQDRLYVFDALLHLLEAAGSPVDEEVARQAMRAQRGLADTTWTMLCHRKPFLLLGRHALGLSPRDVPGGQSAIGVVTQRLFEQLDARQVGLPATALRALLGELGQPFEEWDLRLLRSVLRHDGRFRTAPGGAIGLSEWESVRAPSQTEVLADLLERHGGSVPFDTVAAAIPTASGERLTRGRIGLVANSIRARLVGERVEWMVEAPDMLAALPSVVAQFLQSVPEKTVSHLRKILERPPTPVQLRPDLDNWARLFRDQSATNPAVERDQVERLIRMGEGLLAFAFSHGSTDFVTIACVALAYLIKMDDADADAHVGGLDDDEAVLERAVHFLGIQ